MVLEKACVFYERGINHVIPQFHQTILDKEMMYKVMSSSFADMEFQGGAKLVPFSAEELKEIGEVNAQNWESWTPPKPIRPTIFEQRNQFFSSDTELQPSSKAENVEGSTSVAEALNVVAPQQLTPNPTSETWLYDSLGAFPFYFFFFRNL